MELVKWQFGSLTEEAEFDYISAKMRELRVAAAKSLAAPAEAGAPMGGAGGDVVVHDSSEPAAICDELLPGDVPVCPKCSRPHWRCSDMKVTSVAQEMRAFLTYTEVVKQKEENHGGINISWVKHHMHPEGEIMELLTNVIRAAHRFVKVTEGDRCVDVVLGALVMC